MITRAKSKMERFLGSISDLVRLPAAVFIIDLNKEHIAVAEAHKLNIPTFGIADTNADPTQVDFAIPANDDATKSIALIMETMVKAIEEGLSERKTDKDMDKEKEEEESEVEAGDGPAPGPGPRLPGAGAGGHRRDAPPGARLDLRAFPRSRVRRVVWLPQPARRSLAAVERRQMERLLPRPPRPNEVRVDPQRPHTSITNAESKPATGAWT